MSLLVVYIVRDARGVSGVLLIGQDVCMEVRKALRLIVVEISDFVLLQVTKAR